MKEHDPDRMRARFVPPLQAELAALLDASDRSRESRAPVTLDQQGVGRLSRMDALQNQAMAAGTDARRAQRARAIRGALLRLEAGEFGHCDACGDPIPMKRLDLDPCVICCVGCAR
ncbi:TraR/DksA family transcriptional regulator [Maribius pontilimi]|uniref:TraR/DksA family transcriptional regulator n=1 Tax=Palleronia pontilimi TaxID=1964209 RepID=A0A934I9R8_9RHOB|nr:TraR/DksA C4-type zinc finger protein [Palleronia pontilimi]MBJ3761676.1 TraR/DksA family transcriptional regulator [Palleronia pontilimi]